MKVQYLHEPTDLQCGQAVLAMVLNKKVDEIAKFLNNERETTLKEMKYALSFFGLHCSPQRTEVKDKSELPEICMLSLETPRCWHWSLYVHGTFYDPEHGVMNDFPESKRKYFWEITEP